MRRTTLLFAVLFAVQVAAIAAAPVAWWQTPMTAVSKVSGIRFVDSTDYDQSQLSFINDQSQRMTAYHCTLTTILADGRSEQHDESGEMLLFELEWKAETRVRPWIKPEPNRHFIAPGEQVTFPIPHTEIPVVRSASIVCDVAVYEDGTAESTNAAALQSIINRRTEMALQEHQLIQAATTIQGKGSSIADLHHYTRATFHNALLENELTNLENNKSVRGGEHTAKTDSEKFTHFIADHKIREQAWIQASKITAVNQ